MKTIERKKYLRTMIAVGVSACMLVGSSIGTYAGDVTAEKSAEYAVSYGAGQAERAAGLNVVINGKAYTGETFIEKGRTYIGLRQFSNLMGAKSVTWEAKTKTAVVIGDGIDMRIKHGNNYAEVNGRCLWMESGSFIKNGTMYVPLRMLGQVFGCRVEWNGSTRTASAVKESGAIQSGDSYYNSESLLWLSRIIHAEAEGEPLSGKIAVGNVVLNRVESSQFPNTIHGVIFDKEYGVQFTPTANGAIYNTPNADSVVAAKLCLEGVNLMPNALFFVNEKLAESSWVSDNRECITVIGNHKFFA